MVERRKKSPQMPRLMGLVIANLMLLISTARLFRSVMMSGRTTKLDNVTAGQLRGRKKTTILDTMRSAEAARPSPRRDDGRSAITNITAIMTTKVE